MQIHEALAQIGEIRAQIARAETFRGYRSATVATTALFAVVGAVVQATVIPRPADRPSSYLTLWIAVAICGLGTCLAEMAYRTLRSTSALSRQHTRLALEQFLPCLVAGGVLTYAMTIYAESSLWMLPGLWPMFFALGVFSSYRLLPAETFWVGVWYLVAGVACLAWARGPMAFSPWAMGITFGTGQGLAAAILYLRLERCRDTTSTET